MLYSRPGKCETGEVFLFDYRLDRLLRGKKIPGFCRKYPSNFEYFLSCGIPGELEGERYKKSPELVKELIEKSPKFNAPAPFVVFNRWDMLEESDRPEVVIFFAKPDVLSGLFTLEGFDESRIDAVFTPFGAGCSTIVQYPYLEIKKDDPGSVIGMFDISPRTYVPEDVLSFATPMKKFETIIHNMEESFLITESWRKVKDRKDEKA